MNKNTEVEILASPLVPLKADDYHNILQSQATITLISMYRCGVSGPQNKHGAVCQAMRFQMVKITPQMLPITRLTQALLLWLMSLRVHRVVIIQLAPRQVVVDGSNLRNKHL